MPSRAADSSQRFSNGVLNRICDHVGIEHFNGSEQWLDARSNVRKYSSDISDDMTDTLSKYFAPHLKDLDELLGYNADLLESVQRS